MKQVNQAKKNKAGTSRHLLNAVMAGLILGGAQTAQAAVQTSANSHGPAGQYLASADQGEKAMDKDLHACKGLNSCKGQGGCASAKHDCKGKNACKGLGGCATAKHDCKAMNACKAQGGCKTGDNGCAGKNSCKGKGGCASPVKSMEK